MKGLFFATVIACVALLAGCAATQQAGSVQTDSFLAPYQSLLVEGGNGNRAILHYNDPDVDWASYHKMQLLPVQLLTDSKAELSANDKKALQQLVDAFSTALYNKLSRDYTMVHTPEPGALQMQVAISHGTPSEVRLALVSKLPGPQRLANTVYSRASGKPAFSGGVTLELVIKDAASGRLLAAAADRQVGSMRIFKPNAFDTWGDVENALNFYAESIVLHLCEARGSGDCDRS